MNDRLPGYRQNAFLGPDYATTDTRLSRFLNIGGRVKIELIAECFNAFNRNNQRVTITADSFVNSAGQFVQVSKVIGVNNFPAYYQKPTYFMKATSAYAPRQVQLAVRLTF
jgi:hypothetical protein